MLTTPGALARARPPARRRSAAAASRTVPRRAGRRSASVPVAPAAAQHEERRARNDADQPTMTSGRRPARTGAADGQQHRARPARPPKHDRSRRVPSISRRRGPAGRSLAEVNRTSGSPVASANDSSSDAAQPSAMTHRPASTCRLRRPRSRTGRPRPARLGRERRRVMRHHPFAIDASPLAPGGRSRKIARTSARRGDEEHDQRLHTVDQLDRDPGARLHRPRRRPAARRRAAPASTTPQRRGPAEQRHGDRVEADAAGDRCRAERSRWCPSTCVAPASPARPPAITIT